MDRGPRPVMYRPGKAGLFFPMTPYPAPTAACRAACEVMLRAHAQEVARTRDTSVFNVDGTGLPRQRLATREAPGWGRLRQFQHYVHIIEKEVGGFIHFQQKIICAFVEARVRAMFGSDIGAALPRICAMLGVPMPRRYMFVIGPRQCGKTITIMRAYGIFSAVVFSDSIMMKHLSKDNVAKDMENFERTAKSCDPSTERKAGRSGDPNTSARIVRAGGSCTYVQMQVTKDKDVRILSAPAALPRIRNVRPRRRERRAPLPHLRGHLSARGRAGVGAARAALGRRRAQRARRQGRPGCVRALGVGRRAAHVLRDHGVRLAVQRHDAARAGRAVFHHGRQLGPRLDMESVMDVLLFVHR